ncbi:MAG: hypothetical protein LAT77_02335 [Aliidiomarina sp.]|uniref:hypothetical protein n=1 Tax=Aliidiomarina sp. TaxID=1872439 RepID=UPI0025B86929|nr:hypothetical protein [Aliidiomarina sp.]MCH8500731.1 hypothetical protein [Aliidiomarina sp.]
MSDKKKKSSWPGVGFYVSLPLGVAVGLSIDNIGAGIGIAIVLGLIFDGMKK